VELKKLKQMHVGVSAAGVYFQQDGMLPWSHIKSIKMAYHAKLGECIALIKYRPEELGAEVLKPRKEVSKPRKIVDFFLKVIQDVMPYDPEDDPYIVMFSERNYISISLQELTELLREYHKKYQKEDRALGIDKFPVQKETPVLLARWKRVIVLFPFLFAVFFIIDLIEGDPIPWWFVLIFAAFLTAIRVFRRIDFLIGLLCLTILLVLTVVAFFLFSYRGGSY